ncbi:nicotinate-nucleotide--dimethylbenzimidazole phosphoribosyltransferase [Streptomyces longisporoflavus]|uniref:nicotinate-nucleotide--dimethylbenzimidazole phosphoribosyltransferase n=1 Tax=Streptomyces longisporoflavus TaxID=28044 RepID=UPI00167D0242|nr:nicotinate-nucleotide--dimethylbenzimidazole phosphoribosyltransferase [Streptomyces longisporoflavus]
MTDTGQVPGEGLPENAGMVEQPGVPAPGAYTYLDPSENPAASVAPADDDDLLLMPGAQGAWSEPHSAAPQPVAEQYGGAPYGGAHDGTAQHGVAQPVGAQAGDQQAAFAQAAGQPTGAPSPTDQYAAGQPVADPSMGDQSVSDASAGGQPFNGQSAGDLSVNGQAAGAQSVNGQSAGAQSVNGQSAGGRHSAGHAPGIQPAVDQQLVGQYAAGPQPVAQPQAMHQPGPHETAGRDSGSVDLNGVQLPGAPTPAPASHPGPSRRPLHRGPSGPAVPDGTGSPVRSLADRGPAGAPQHSAPMRHAGPPTVGPEYLDIPRDAEGMPGPQLGEIAPQGATPWTAQPAQPAPADQPSRSAQPVAPAETVVPDATSVTDGAQDAQAAPDAQAAQDVQAAQDPQNPLAGEAPQPAAAFPQAPGAADPETAQGVAADDQFAHAAAEAGQPAFTVDAEQPPAEQASAADQAAAPVAADASAVDSSAPASEVSQELPLAADAEQLSAVGQATHTPDYGQPQFAVAGAQPWSDAPLAAAGHTLQGPHIPQSPQQPDAPAAPAPAPLGQFVPVEGSVPTTPHLAPTPPHALSVPPEHVEAPQPDAPEAQPESAAEAEAPAPDAVPAAAVPETPVAPEVPETPEAQETQEDQEAQEPSALLEVAEAPEAHEAAEGLGAPEAAAPAEADATPEPASPQPAATVPAPRDGNGNAAATAAPAPTEEPVPEAPEPAAEALPLAAGDAPVAAEIPEPTEAPEPMAAPEPAAAAEAGPGEETEAADDAAPSEPVTEPEAAQLPEPVKEADTPAAPAYDDAEREAVLRVMRERRDIRNGFRSDAIPHEVLLRVLEAAHTAPSVGHSQPWDFVVIRSAETRRTMHELAMRQKDAYAKSLPKGRAKQFKELKIEAILDTPVNIVVTADPTRGGRHTLGRHTQPQMAPYSSALAVENLWLAARAEGLGVGWVSFFDEREMVRTLGLPEHLEVVAYLCVGYVDEFPQEPELMQAGWSKRRPLSWVVHEETYGRRALPGEDPHDLLAETVSNIRPLDAKALGEAWERQKRMTKPPGALGMLEIISAQLSGLSRQCPPPIPEPAAVAIFAGDHGVHAQGVTAWPQEVTAQMVANFLGGGAVCNAFANQVGAEVCVIDVGVASELPATPGLLPRKIRAGTADMTTGPALSREEVKAAVEVGIETARDLVAAGNKALLTGEMGIANTTASAALISVYTDTDPGEVTGRGTGINDEMHSRKVDVVRRALELHQPDPADPIGVLAAIGGLEHAAMVGLLLGGASLRTPVILDGVSAGAAALVARAIAPEVLAACIAGHRSAEPGHVAALNKLGLRPLVDLDLRLGEGTGALLALPVVQSAARAMHEVATFDSAGVTEK